ncbi:MAG TPA: patatin-like phospholipase family protein [Candidatus Saccharimonadales bacterium]
MAAKPCDIVLEGGGVKGIGLVGALTELEKSGFESCRVAGTSAGAIVGCLLAAGAKPSTLVTLMQSIDYKKFRDETLLSKLSVPGKITSILFEKGIYRGNYAYKWLLTELDKLGVRTFADLKLTEQWATALPPEQRYKLVVIVSDITRGRMVRLPWDYHEYGLNADDMLVADAVRASMSIPYFYRPAKLKGRFLVDGGILSNFPIDIFDNVGEWPTFGVKLSAKPEAFTKMNPVTNPVDYGLAILSTTISAHDKMHLDDPCAQARTMFVDTFDIKATHFDITTGEQRALFTSGQKTAKDFLEGWDFKKYQLLCPSK